MRYSERLWDAHQLLEETTNDGKRSLEEALKYFSGKRALLLHTSKATRKLVRQSRLEQFEMKGELSSTLNSVLELEERLCMGAFEGELAALDEVQMHIEEARAQYTHRSKAAFSEIAKIRKEVREAYSRMDKARMRYYKCCKEFEVSRLEESDFLDDMLTMATTQERIQARYKDVLRSNEVYSQMVKEVRTMRESMDRKVCHLLDALQGVELERLQAIQECFERYFAVSLGSTGAAMSEIQNVLGSISTVDVSKDLELFIEKNSRLTKPDVLPEFEEFPIYETTFELKSPTGVPTMEEKTYEESELEGFWELYFAHLRQCKSESGCECGWKRQEDPAPIIHGHDGRSAFASLLNLQRSVDGGNLPSRRTCRVLGALTREILDIIWELRGYTESSAPLDVDVTQGKRDLHVIKIIMILSQSIYFLSPDSNVKHYLKDEIHSHPIWKDMRTWEEMFFEAYCIEVNNNRVKSVEKWMSEDEQAYLTSNNMNVLFGQMTSFALSMILFDVDRSKVEGFIRKVSTLHNLTGEMVVQLLGILE